MRIIIIGAGEVGTEIAAKLCSEDHDVTVIDKKRNALDKLANLDVLTLQGNGASLDLLESAGLKDTDLLIAVTQVDEINIMACLLAKNYGARKTIARVRQTEFGNEYRSITNERLGIDVVINPELVAANEIIKVVKSTTASEVEFFAQGKVQLLGFRLTEDSPLLNRPLQELTFDNSLVVGINRDNTLLVPSGRDVLKSHDHIYLICKTAQHFSYEWLTGKPSTRVDNVMIMGAGKVGRHVARLLGRYNNAGIKVKLVEHDFARCREVAAQLHQTMVLHGSGTDLEFLCQENIEDVDVFIAVSGSDETNILSALLAKKLGVRKTIVEINRPDYAMLVETLDIDTAIRPRLLTASRILRLVRKGSIISITILGEDQAEIIELEIKKGSEVLGKPLRELKLPAGILVGAIIRGDQALIPKGNDFIKSGDRVVLFALKNMVKQAALFIER